MPSAFEILAVLKSISNDYHLFANIWHILIYLAIVLLLMKWKPSRRAAVLLLSLLLASVAVFAWLSGNPFNGVLFSVIAVFFLVTGLNLPKESVMISSLPYRTAGIALLLFGLWYPHFMAVDSFLPYLYAAPTGLIPCPTLSVVIGFALICNGFNSNPVRIILLCYGFFYGLFGIFRLGVYLDTVLLTGTMVFLAQILMHRQELHAVKR